MAETIGMYKSIKAFRHPCVIQPHTAVYEVRLCRPEKFNCLNMEMIFELQDFFQKVEGMDFQDCRIVFICGEGSTFCGGLDLEDYVNKLVQGASADVGYRALDFQRKILQVQRTFDLIDSCRVPVIAAMHGAIIGAGVGLAAACDMRVCSENTTVMIKDIEMGLAADVGVVSLMQKTGLPLGWLKELCFSMRVAKAAELRELGFVNHVADTPKASFLKAFDMCRKYGRKSPVAVIGTKKFINFARDHSIQETVDSMTMWNSAMLQSSDFVHGVEKAQIEVRKRMNRERQARL